jgi:HlyD family secretion protein
MKRLVIIVIVLILIGVGICVGGSLLAPRLIGNREGTPRAMETPFSAEATAIRARGRLVPARVETLGFSTSGTVGQIDVEPDDEVAAGQVIARLDTTDLEWAVSQAEDALLATRLTYSQTVRPPTPEEIAAAEATLRSAEAGLVSARAGLIGARIAVTSALQARDALTGTRLTARANLGSAQASLASAQASLTALQTGPDPDAVEQARLNWEQARNNLARMQLERDAVQARPGVPGYVREQMKLDIANLEAAVRLAEMTYQKAQSAGPTEEALAAARASVAAAEAGVIGAQAQVDGVDDQIAQAEVDVIRARAAVAQAEAGVQQAEASVEQARRALERLRAGPDELAEAQAALQVRQAEASLARARNAMADVEIRAPFDGTVSEVHVNEDAPAAAGAPAVTVVDLSGWLVETEDLDEWGVNRIAADEPVTLIFTAFDDKTLTGRVVEIDRTPTELPSGDVTYRVAIAVDESDPALRWGMSVRVEFAKSE